MVYCNYLRNTKNSVTYAYGPSPHDLSGVFTFDFENDMIEFEKKPKGLVLERHLQSLLRKHYDEFKEGIFKEKIAYEI